MKLKILVNCVCVILIALLLAFTVTKNEDAIKIELSKNSVSQYQKHLANISKVIEPSKLTGEQIVYIKSQMDSATLVLLKNIKQPDTIKKIKK